MVMLILKRRYEFWFSTIALHKLGAVVIPATHLLTKKDIVYRANAATIKMIVCAGEEVILKHVQDALPESPSVEKVVSVGPLVPEGFADFQAGIREAAPFVRPAHVNSNDDISLMYLLLARRVIPRWWLMISFMLWDISPLECIGITSVRIVFISLLPTQDGARRYGERCTANGLPELLYSSSTMRNSLPTRYCGR